MKLADATMLVTELLEAEGFDTHFTELMTCGSIRRQKAEVNDIDLVGIVKKEYAFGEPSLSQTIHKLDPSGEKEAKNAGKQGAGRFLDGEDIKRFKFKGAMIDLYLAKPEEYETLCLIRTGSKEHNIRLTTLAMGKGMKLFASGKGLWKVTVANDGKERVPTELVSNTEKGILETLLGKYVEPVNRGI